MNKEKLKEKIKKANKCREFIQTTSVAIVLALIIVAKSQRFKYEFKKDATKGGTLWNQVNGKARCW